jgi:5-enolpyruvylshikimate-3-phosphate synthase
MLGAIAGIASQDGVRLEGAESAAISFPGFYDVLASLAVTGEIG